MSSEDATANSDSRASTGGERLGWQAADDDTVADPHEQIDGSTGYP